MSDVTEFTVWCPLAWHCYEHTIISVDHTNIVNNKFIINGNRSNRLHSPLGINSAESYIRNLHYMSPPFYIKSLVNNSTNQVRILLVLIKYFDFCKKLINS